MTFVFPILLGGLALLAVPVLLHLIYRQKPRMLRFPAFRFLVQRHKTNQRKLKLRHFLLLVMRMLLLALICLALARPKVAGDLLQLQTDRPVVAVLVFDTSYSMQYKVTGDRTRLDDAKEKAVGLLSSIHPDSRVAVLYTAEAGQARGEWLKPDKAIAEINSLSLRYDSAPVTSRLEDAYHLIRKLSLATDDEIGRRLPRVLWVFSDRTQACWDANKLPYLQNLADSILPPLERLHLLHGSIPAKTEILKRLRQELPPPPTVDYPEQSLIGHWEELRQKIPGASWDNFPSPELAKLVGQIQNRSRELLKLLRDQNVKDLSEQDEGFRTQVIDSVEKGLAELQGVAATFVDVGVEDADDLGIGALNFFATSYGSLDQRQVFSAKEKFQLQVEVLATGARFENSLVCELDDREYRRQIVQVERGDRKTYTFEFNGEGLSPGYHQLQLSLSAKDQLAFTNRRYATFLIRPPREVLILTDEPQTATAFRKAIEFNRKVQFRCKVDRPEGEEYGPQQLGRYDAVYLLNVAKPSDNLWQALKTYVQQGGNVGIIPGGKPEDATAYNSNPVAQSLLPGQLVRVVESKDGVRWHWPETDRVSHPFLRQFGEWKRMGNIDFIQTPPRAYRFWETKPHSGAGVGEVVRYEGAGGTAALLERTPFKGGGTVVLLTTRLDFPVEPLWNDYLKLTSSWAVVFPGELTIYLAGDLERKELNFITGRTVPSVAIPPGKGIPAFVLRGPVPQELVPRPDQLNNLLLRNAVVPGNYTVDAGKGDGTPDVIGAFSVNLPPEEGLLSRVPLVEIEDLFGRGSVRTLQQGDTLDEVLAGVWSTPEELLPVLMLALLALLALENLLANLFYRREPPAAESGGLS